MKIAKKLTVHPSIKPWFVEVEFPYDEELKAVCKVPGSTWFPTTKRWQIPIEMLELVKCKAKELGYE